MNVFVAGSRGMFARDFAIHHGGAGAEVKGADLPELDITDPVSVVRAFESARPAVVVNAAAYTAVDRAETEPDAAFAANRDGAAVLADACAARSIPLVHLSTDFVFDGALDRPYREDDPPRPLGVYGASKLAGEEEVRRRCPAHAIVRTSWLYGIHGGNFVAAILALARGRGTIRVVEDQVGSPTWTGDLAAVVWDIVRLFAGGDDTSRGTWHVCGRGHASRYELAVRAVELARAHEPLAVHDIVPASTDEFPRPAPRPRWSVLDTGRIEMLLGRRLRDWEDGLADMIAARCRERAGG